MRVSASQVRTARACMRRWAWDRVARAQPSPEQAASLDLGKTVHALAEAYHKTGQQPDRTTLAGRMVLHALSFLPPPRSGTAELEIFLHEPDFVGYVDLLAPARSVPGFPAGPEWIILDYKTKNSFSRGLFEGAGDMLTDEQALVYAQWYFTGALSRDTVGMRWVYMRASKTPATRVCDAVLTRAQVQDAFDRLIAPKARELIQLRTRPLEPLTLEPNPLECMRYGPRYACPYVNRCKLTPAEKLAGGLDKMALIDELRAKHGGNKGVNPPEGQASVQEQAAREIAKAKEASSTSAIPAGVMTDEQILAACLRALGKRLG